MFERRTIFLKIVNNTLKIKKKWYASQTHFGFINMGSEMNSIRVIAKRHFKFWFGSPCITFYWSSLNRFEALWVALRMRRKSIPMTVIETISRTKNILQGESLSFWNLKVWSYVSIQNQIVKLWDTCSIFWVTSITLE